MSASITAHAPRRVRRLQRPIRRTPLRMLGFLGLGAAAVVAVLVLAAGLYISRSAYTAGHQPTPTAAATGLLYAVLHDRDADSAAKYLCDGHIRHQVDRLVGRIRDYTATGEGTIAYTWRAKQTARHGDRATVTATVTAHVTQRGLVSTQPPQRWTLAMRNRSGWKACRLTIAD